MATWINEFPHRTAQLHWHPTGGDHFSLDLVTEALEKGISSIELDMHLVGGDICEVAPCFDPTGITCVTAANLMWEMLCVLADSKAKSGKR